MAKNIDTMKTFLTTANDIVKALGEANPRDEEFDDLLLRHERLCQNALRYMDVQERISFFLSEMEKVENGDEIEVQPISKVTPISKPKKTKAKVETEPAAEEHPVEQPLPVEEKSDPEPTPIEEEPALEPTPIEETKPVPEPTAAVPDTPIALADIKAAFIEAARSGIKVAEIIADTGYTKLSDVPSELYAALMRALERKKNGVE